MDLYVDTSRLLEETELSPEEVGKQAGINPRWVRRFKTKEMESPGVIPTQKLFNFLLSHASSESSVIVEAG